jgi:hypothetical protein
VNIIDSLKRRFAETISQLLVYTYMTEFELYDVQPVAISTDSCLLQRVNWHKAFTMETPV